MDLQERIKQVMIEHLAVDPSSIAGDTSFTQVLGLDSLDATDLLVAIDDALGIRIPPKEMASIDTLDELVAVVRKLQAR